MQTTPEAAIQEAWAADATLSGAIGVDRVTTGWAAEDADVPRVEIQPGTTALNTGITNRTTIDTLTVTMVVRAKTLDQARNIATPAIYYFNRNALPLLGWMETWAASGSTVHEGEGIWAITIDLEIMRYTTEA